MNFRKIFLDLFTISECNNLICAVRLLALESGFAPPIYLFFFFLIFATVGELILICFTYVDL